MQLLNPQLHIGSNVRIRSHGSSQHFGRGRLLRIEGKQAVVKPFQRHRQEERVPLSDLYSWAAGNPRPAQTGEAMTDASATFSDGPWVLADVENVRFFVSSWAGFQPELSRAKVYDKLRSVNHSATFARKRRADETGRVEVLTTAQAQQLVQDRFYPKAEAPEPVAARPPVQTPVIPALELTKANPEDLRLAASILHRMADAESMYREAEAELQKVCAEWKSLEERILAGNQAAAAGECRP